MQVLNHQMDANATEWVAISSQIYVFSLGGVFWKNATIFVSINAPTLTLLYAQVFSSETPMGTCRGLISLLASSNPEKQPWWLVATVFGRVVAVLTG